MKIKTGGDNLVKRKTIRILVAVSLAIVLCLLPALPAGAVDNPQLAARWDFDEGTGATASDRSDNTNDGTLSGGKFGNALDFDGIDDYVDCGNVIQLDGLSAFTVEFWIKVDSLPFPDKWEGIIARGSSPERTPWIFVNKSNSNLYMQFETTTGGPADCSLITDNLTAGQWHHVAFTWDGTTVTSYLDGSAGPIDTTIGSVLVDTTESLKFGYIPDYAYFDGLIDEVHISDVARTSFVLTSPPSADSNTVALWHLDESFGSTVFDETANNNDGTINGASWAGPRWTSGMFDDALSFDGTDDYVDCGSSAKLKPTTDITIEMWVKPGATQAQWADILGGHQNNQGYVV